MSFFSFFRRAYFEFHSISWSSKSETALMTFVVILGVAASSLAFLSVDYVVFRLLKLVYQVRF